jgi:hypothetical protein
MSHPLVSEDEDSLSGPGVLAGAEKSMPTEQTYEILLRVAIHIAVICTGKPRSNVLKGVTRQLGVGIGRNTNGDLSGKPVNH